MFWTANIVTAIIAALASQHHSLFPTTFTMKRRILILAVLSICVLSSAWMFFFTELHPSKLSLGLLGDAFDIIHPVSNDLSGLNDTHLDALLSNETTDSSGLPSGSPSYYNKDLDLFENTYVVSLPHRTDRRISMERLRQYISANWTYVDAVNAEDQEISWLLECVRSMRDSGASTTSNEVFAWPQEFDPNPSLLHGESPPNRTQTWCPQPDASTGLPSAASTDDQRPELPPLTCATRNSTSGPPYSPVLPPYMVLTPSKIACWRSHMQILERFAYEKTIDAENAHDVALILEDDVDMERDIRKRLHNIRDDLPQDQWDLLFLGACRSNSRQRRDIYVPTWLGHCWSNEEYHPAIATLALPHSNHRASTLHPSLAPKCTHAYAVSRAGALKIVQHLQHPPFAYSRALDQAYSWLIVSGRVQSYSIVPSLVVQRKITASDVDAGESGVGSVWKDSLDDGILAA